MLGMIKKFLISYALLVAFSASTVLAAFTTQGDVDPTDPSTWTSSTTGYVGKTGTGVLTVNSGSNLLSYLGLVGCDSGSTGTATVTGSGSKWTNSNELGVGWIGNGTLNIEAGGAVSNSNAYVGYDSGSSGTTTVTGTGSKWTNTGTLWIGLRGNGMLSIEAGGQVSNDWAYVGSDSGSTSSATVTGSGSKWTNTGPLRVGSSGNGTLNIEAGGEVSNRSAYVGYDSGSTGTATVTGTGSKWTNTSGLIVGYWGKGTLNIEAGGEVSNSGDCIVDNQSGSTSTATVTGTGSKWTNTGVLWVGQRGNGTLNIEAGGEVSNRSAYVGYDSGSTGTATITGTGSMWTNSADLFIASYGSGTLTVSDGGVVIAQTIYASPSNLLGNGTISTKGAVLDTGLIFDDAYSGSLVFGTGGVLNLTLDGTGNLGAGYKGTGTLSIADGLAIASSVGYLGYYSGSTGTATVTGSSSKWTNSDGLYVGYYGNGTLNIEAGGEVSNIWCRMGSNSGSTGTATVTGSDSKWTNSFLYVGSSGNGTLNIEAGGEVSNGYGYVGYNSGSTGTATVTGIGSKLTNSYDLYVGYSDNGTLNIEAGGEVSNRSGYVGYNSGSTGSAALTGTGSKWTNSVYLVVGEYGTGSVTQSGGTNSVGGTLYLGRYFGSKGTYNLNGGALILKSLAKGSGTAAFNFGGGTLQASGNFTTSLPMTLTGTNGNANIDTQGYTVTFSGSLTGTGGLKKLGTGVLELTGFSNTFAGAINFKEGLIKAAGLSKLGSGTALNFDGGGLKFNGVFDPSVRTMTFLAGGAALDTQTNNIIFANAVGNNGTGGLTKLGTGKLTLNALNTYSGDTIVKGGTLEFSKGIAAGGTSLVDVQSGKAVFKTTNISKLDLDISTAALATFEVQNGTHEVGDIFGSGITQVDSGAILTAGSIKGGSLIVAAGGKVIIRPIAGGPLGEMIAPVPEPSLVALLGGAAFCLGCGWARKATRGLFPNPFYRV